MAKELELCIEFKRVHTRRGENSLHLVSTDKMLIDRVKRWVDDLTNSNSKVKMVGTEYEVEYSFNTIKFDKVTRLFKKYNMGLIKAYKKKNNNFYIKGNDVHMDKDMVNLNKVFRVFVDPENRKLTLLTLPNLVGYEHYYDTLPEFLNAVEYINDSTPKYREYINPVIQKYKTQKRADSKKKDPVGGNFYEVVFKDKKVTIATNRILSEVKDTMKKMYKDEVKSVTPVHMVTLEDMVREYNLEVSTKIKALQELKIINL